MTHQQNSFTHELWCYGSYENNNNSNDSYSCNNSTTGYCNSFTNDYNTQSYQPSQILPDNNGQLQNPNQYLYSSWSSSASPSNPISRSNSTSPSNDSRRGRPLIPDSLQESEKTKEKRNYARKYREKVQIEKTKLKEENDQLRHLIQRFLFLHSILPQNVEVEIQRLKNEFRDLNDSNKNNNDKLKNCNIFTFS
uniref:BZIP domain-containing protein n=1 Tax=Panagrolaimus davidi TaxID=227884 RepID=A0A914PJ80_9BILA